ncbi:response regulator [Dawidia soli]|uniref:Response regulator n=1 Tax=Dawidia soli TaxID=2782352 RepID=A0AAP2DAD3_9BACT|nr:response regulator [Dawidia soli]MBT1688074.1 response regulator [Dawidia soli]
MPKSKRLIYIDDDEDDILVLAEVLLQVNNEIECISAVNAQEGLDLLEHGDPPHYIFLDINMPRISGKQCLQLIRANPRYDHVPVVMLSTSTSDADVKECMALGATAFLVKPSDLSTFSEKLRTLFQNIHHQTLLRGSSRGPGKR